jgi:hypothetical protein
VRFANLSIHCVYNVEVHSSDKVLCYRASSSCHVPHCTSNGLCIPLHIMAS